MMCPECDNYVTYIIDSYNGGNYIRRRRRCPKCRYRFTTIERIYKTGREKKGDT